MDIAPIILAYLLPTGALLVAWGSWDAQRARTNTATALMVMALAALTYTAIGFGFQFGGVGLRPDVPAGLHGLDRLWSFAGGSTQTWGIIGLKGFWLNVPSTQPGDTALVFTLFLHQLPIVMAAALVPALALAGRARHFTLVFITMLMAGLIVPLIGMWTWGGGWLNTLGDNVKFGHGFIDPGGAAAIFMAAGCITLAALSALKIRKSTAPAPAQLPPIYLPLRTIAGAIAFGFGWLAWLTTDPILQSNRSIDLAFGATNVLLGASAATLVALAYGWFTTGKPDSFLAARGALGGWIASSATALFVPTWAAIAIGAVAGLWLPIGLYCIDRFLHLDDPSGSIATAGLSGLWSIIAAGLLADGTYGAGWNAIGVRDYLGVPGQGVTGLLAGANLQNDPGQMSAQITGAITIVCLALIVTWLLTRPLRRVNERGLEIENLGSELRERADQPRNQTHNHRDEASEEPSEEVII